MRNSQTRSQRLVTVGVFYCVFWGVICRGADSPLQNLFGQKFTARDTLTIGQETNADARECLAKLSWTPIEFGVQCVAPATEHGAALIRFPSPIPSGEELNDSVALEWYPVLGDDGQPQAVPAVVVVHESGRAMPVGRLFARGFQQRGVQAFMIQLPHYGVRRGGTDRPRPAEFLTALRQAVADVRRARDAVASLPHVPADNISLQGTSLGGFVSSTSAALDHGYQRAFLTLCGGDLYSILMEGKKDAAGIRERLQQAGITNSQLQEWSRTIEPLRIAHRLDPQRTFLYAGLFDDVVPIRNARLLADAAKLPVEHRTELPADHYVGILLLPIILDHMATQIHGRPIAGPPLPADVLEEM